MTDLAGRIAQLEHRVRELEAQLAARPKVQGPAKMQGPMLIPPAIGVRFVHMPPPQDAQVRPPWAGSTVGRASRE